MKHHWFTKTIAASLLMAFSVSEFCYAAPEEAHQLQLSPNHLAWLIHNPSSLEAPESFCSLKEIHDAGGDTLIIHIQDPHSNYSGQLNLAGALDEIMEKYQISLVMVEGGFGDGSLTPIRKAMSAEECRRTAKRLLVEGQISGEEYLNLTSERPMKIIGVENVDLYAASLLAYSKLAEKREEMLSYLNRITVSIEKLKTKLYSKELLDYEKNSRAAESEAASNIDGLLMLAGKARVDLSRFPGVSRLAELRVSEKKIDFTAATLEQAALLEKLKEKCGAEDISKRINGSDQTKQSKSPNFSFFQNILNIAEEKGVSLDTYPNLVLYHNYIKKFTELDLDAISAESLRVEDEVYRILLPDADARTLKAIDRYIGLLKTAYNIKMTTDEFRQFEANEPDFATPAYLAFINRHLAQCGWLSELVPYQDRLEDGKKRLVGFYSSVGLRDAAFVKNAEKLLAKEKRRAAVLITGGYHTQNLKQIFQARQWSYAVLAPAVTAQTNQRKYEDLLFEPLGRKNKKVDVVQGESRNDRPLASLAGNLAGPLRKDGIRSVFAMGRAVGVILQGSTVNPSLFRQNRRAENRLKYALEKISRSSPHESKSSAVGGARLAGFDVGKENKYRDGRLSIIHRRSELISDEYADLDRSLLLPTDQTILDLIPDLGDSKIVALVESADNPGELGVVLLKDSDDLRKALKTGTIEPNDTVFEKSFIVRIALQRSLVNTGTVRLNIGNPRFLSTEQKQDLFKKGMFPFLERRGFEKIEVGLITEPVERYNRSVNFFTSQEIGLGFQVSLADTALAYRILRNPRKTDAIPITARQKMIFNMIHTISIHPAIIDLKAEKEFASLLAESLIGYEKNPNANESYPAFMKRSWRFRPMFDVYRSRYSDLSSKYDDVTGHDTFDSFLDVITNQVSTRASDAARLASAAELPAQTLAPAQENSSGFLFDRRAQNLLESYGNSADDLNRPLPTAAVLQQLPREEIALFAALARHLSKERERSVSWPYSVVSNDGRTYVTLVRGDVSSANDGGSVLQVTVRGQDGFEQAYAYTISGGELSFAPSDIQGLAVTPYSGKEGSLLLQSALTMENISIARAAAQFASNMAADPAWVIDSGERLALAIVVTEANKSIAEEVKNRLQSALDVFRPGRIFVVLADISPAGALHFAEEIPEGSKVLVFADGTKSSDRDAVANAGKKYGFISAPPIEPGKKDSREFSSVNYMAAGLFRAMFSGAKPSDVAGIVTAQKDLVDQMFTTLFKNTIPFDVQLRFIQSAIEYKPSDDPRDDENFFRRATLPRLVKLTQEILSAASAAMIRAISTAA